MEGFSFNGRPPGLCSAGSGLLMLPTTSMGSDTRRTPSDQDFKGQEFDNRETRS